MREEVSIMSSEPEIVMVTNAIAPDKLGGLERYVRELSAGLVRAGRRVSILTKQVNRDDPLEEWSQEGIRIIRHRVPSKELTTFALRYPGAVFRGVWDGLRSAPRDAIFHGHYAISSLPLALSTRSFIQTFHAPVYKEVLAERGGSYVLPTPVQRAGVGSVRLAETLVLGRSRSNVVLSQFMFGELADLSTRAPSRTTIIPGGIDVEWFSPATSKPTITEPASPLLFAARRLTTRTGVPELVRAMSILRHDMPASRLAIAGDGHERATIEALIESEGLRDRVVLLGRISDADLRDWYRAADLVITPTQALEGFGLSTAEAMACGTACLVTPVGANPELVAGIDPGLVAAGTAGMDLAAAIKVLAGDEERLRRLGLASRQRAQAEWSWSRVVDSYLELYSAQSLAWGGSLRRRNEMK